MAYGISALIEQRQAGGETLPAEEAPAAGEAEAPAEAVAEAAPAEEAASPEPVEASGEAQAEPAEEASE
jgi:hypothetical protein